MKRNQRILALMLVIITLLTLLPVSALASSINTLKFDEVYMENQLEDKNGDSIVYKMILTEDSAIIVKYIGSGEISLYKDSKCKKVIATLYDWYADGICILYRGTYYIKAQAYGSYSGIKITKKAVKDTGNYCVSKAITMKKNKKYEVAQTIKHNYMRWYKIKLTKSQVISIITNKQYFDITVYDNEFESIDCKYNEETKTLSTRGRQPKGTYYVSFCENYITDMVGSGSYYTLSWK